MVEAGRVRLEVPLTDEGRLVAGVAQEFRERRLRSVEGIAVGHQAVGVAVLTRQHGGPAGRADGIAAETPVEDHTLGSDAVDVGGLVDDRAVRADRLHGVVVGEDENDVGSGTACPSPGRLRGGRRSEDEGRGHQTGQLEEITACG